MNLSSDMFFLFESLPHTHTDMAGGGGVRKGAPIDHYADGAYIRVCKNAFLNMQETAELFYTRILNVVCHLQADCVYFAISKKTHVVSQSLIYTNMLSQNACMLLCSAQSFQCVHFLAHNSSDITLTMQGTCFHLFMDNGGILRH